jgi:hypothetical protein
MPQGFIEWVVARRGLYCLAAGLILGAMLMASEIPARGWVAGTLGALALAAAILSDCIFGGERSGRR